MRTYAQLLRVNQWVKNLFIFAAAFFGGVIRQEQVLVSLIIGFFTFCAVSSAVYILNDYLDAAADREHPEKKKRPIASGAVKPAVAFGIMAVLLIAAGISAWYFVNLRFLGVLIIYVSVNIGYSLGLKKIALLDIVLVSSGFILRVLAGGFIAGVAISHWLFIMTFLLAMFVAIAKRRDDLVLLEQTGKSMRSSISGYNMEFVNIAMGMMSAVIIVSYIMYTTSAEIIEYLQIALVEKKSGSPTKIFLKDIFIQLTILGWLAYFAFSIYFLGNGIK
ncbi:MAG: UbiA prenyltransferase [Bacteroidetes bacterium]|nr:MAG: UbiA prenyltransferase [Bacteroidota bacterium]